MDLQADLKRIVIESLNAAGVTFNPSAEVNELLIAALTIEERQIPAQPRNVHVAQEFNAAMTTLSADCQAGVTEIQRKLKAGEDVNPHLNLRSLQPTKDDDLLTDWGIYHFHLGLQPIHGGRFFERTGPLAFAHVTPSDVFLINILEHGNFAEPKLVETLIRRFPTVAEAHEMKGMKVTAFPPPKTAIDIEALRKVHVNSPLCVDGRLYFGPGSGFVSSGVSFRAVHRANATQKIISELNRVMQIEEDSVRRQVAANHPGTNPAQLDFELICHEKQWSLFEKTTQSLLRFGP
jgi:hypothetical protein